MSIFRRRSSGEGRAARRDGAGGAVSEEEISKMSLAQIMEVFEHKRLGVTTTTGILSALFRRLIGISYYDHNIPDDLRRTATRLANAVRADLEKGENDPEQLEAIRKACEKTMANARGFGYGSLLWLLDEHKVPASDTIAFMLKPEHGHLLSGTAWLAPRPL
jgi:hypothetical protein